MIAKSKISDEERAKLAEIEGTLRRKFLLYPDGKHTDECDSECLDYEENDFFVSFYNECQGYNPRTLYIRCCYRGKHDIDEYYGRGDFVKPSDDSIDHYLFIYDSETHSVKGADITNPKLWHHFQTEEIVR